MSKFSNFTFRLSRTFSFPFAFLQPFLKRWAETYGLYSDHFPGLRASNCFLPRNVTFFEGCSMVPFKKAVLWFWMDNLVAHFTIQLSFRVSSDLCHTDIGERSGTANCTAGCSKTQVVWPHLHAWIRWLCWLIMTQECTHAHARQEEWSEKPEMIGIRVCWPYLMCLFIWVCSPC